MDGGWALILSAVVTAVGGIIITVISRFRKENHIDHNTTMGVLRIMYQSMNRVEAKVDKVDRGLTNHLISHATEGLDNGRRTNKNRVEGDTEVSK